MSEYDAAAKLCELHAGRLAGFLVARGTPPALVEDVIQDSFLVLCRKGEEVLNHPNPAAYLYRIARGVAADRRRSEASRSANERTWYPQTGRQPCDPNEAVARHVDVHHALAQLSLRQREVVYLHRCIDLSLDDVAEILHISKGAVNTHLRRGEARLRELLDDGDRGGAR